MSAEIMPSSPHHLTALQSTPSRPSSAREVQDRGPLLDVGDEVADHTQSRSPIEQSRLDAEERDIMERARDRTELFYAERRLKAKERVIAVLKEENTVLRTELEAARAQIALLQAEPEPVEAPSPKPAAAEAVNSKPAKPEPPKEAEPVVEILKTHGFNVPMNGLSLGMHPRCELQLAKSDDLDQVLITFFGLPFTRDMDGTEPIDLTVKEGQAFQITGLAAVLKDIITNLIEDHKPRKDDGEITLTHSIMGDLEKAVEVLLH